MMNYCNLDTFNYLENQFIQETHLKKIFHMNFYSITETIYLRAAFASWSLSITFLGSLSSMVHFVYLFFVYDELHRFDRITNRYLDSVEKCVGSCVYFLINNTEKACLSGTN